MDRRVVPFRELRKVAKVPKSAIAASLGVPVEDVLLVEESCAAYLEELARQVRLQGGELLVEVDLTILLTIDLG